MFEYESTFPVKGGDCDGTEKAVRCREGRGKTAWRNTEYCMKEVGIAGECYCPSPRHYAIVDHTKYWEFEACCVRQSGSREGEVDVCGGTHQLGLVVN
jgi:hypothetical protein